MKCLDHPSYVLDAWVLFEALRRLGFASKDIYASVTMDPADISGRLWFGVTLRTQKKEFTALLEPSSDPEGALASWTAFAERLAAGQLGEHEMQREWKERFLKHPQRPVALLNELRSQGFYLPLSKN